MSGNSVQRVFWRVDCVQGVAERGERGVRRCEVVEERGGVRAGRLGRVVGGAGGLPLPLHLLRHDHVVELFGQLVRARLVLGAVDVGERVDEVVETVAASRLAFLLLLAVVDIVSLIDTADLCAAACLVYL